MSSQQRNFQSMNGVLQLDDGAGGILQDGNLTCISINCETIETLALDTINLNVRDNLATNELAIGHNIAIGNNAICNKLYANDLQVTNQINTKNICCEKIVLKDNQTSLDITNLGYIKSSLLGGLLPVLTSNIIKKPINIYLKNGVYIFNYSFNLSLSGTVTNPASFTYGLSSDGLTYDICRKSYYSTFTFNNLTSHPYFYESCVYEVKDNNYITLLVSHNTVTNGLSNALIQASKITATRIA